MSGQVAARRSTLEAASRLRGRRGVVGRVDSVFARTVNVRMASGAHVTLQGPGPLLAPFAIECDASLDLSPRSAGAPVSLHAGRLDLGRDGPRVALSGAAIWAGRLRAAPPRGDIRIPDDAPAGGLLPLLADLGPEGPRARGSPAHGAAVLGDAALSGGAALCDAAGPAVQRLVAASRAGDAGGVLEAAGALVGLGPGLTPSGDDLLVGWAAALHAHGGQARRLVRRVAGPLAALAARRTTPLAADFLACALRGRVSEPLARLVNAPAPDTCRDLLACGATSGGDVLVGWVAGNVGLPSGAARHGPFAAVQR